jgi:hypothetical protein
MCQPSTIMVAVVLGAAVAGSPVAVRMARDRFGGGGRGEPRKK